MNPNNPLKQYFRQPSIYIKLPSQGKYYPEGALEVTENGEYPVYPMTAIDEITYRTPDALFNGQAVVDVIQSCVPNIKNGWAIPSVDLDALLVAIRIASYGHQMDFATTCPNCKHTDDLGLDLRVIIDRLKSNDYDQSIKHGDLEFFFKPMSYKNVTDNSKLQYEQQRILSQLPAATAANAEEVSKFNFADAFKHLTEVTVKALAQSIASVKTSSALVTESDYIVELLLNCDRKLFNQIRDHIIAIKAGSEIPPLSIECSECQFKYEQPITLNMTNFFGDAS